MFNLGDFSMKKTLVAIAALAAVSSFAQSTVTLYGVADVWLGSLDARGLKLDATGQYGGLSIDNTTGVGTFTPAGAAAVPQKQTVLNTGGLSGSRFGLRGSEDLGGGLKANFVMENGHNTETGAAGQGGLLFGRQAFVGLSGGFGEVRFGRQYPAYDEARGGSDLFGHSAFSTTVANGSWGAFGRDYTYRVNNALHYITPNMGGLTAAITYALGENKTGATAAGKLTSLRISYANGPISAALAYQQEKNAAGNTLTGCAVTATSACNPLGQSDGNLFGLRGVAFSAGYTPTSETHTFLTGAYDFGVARVQLAMNRSKDNSDIGADKDVALNVAVPLGATTLVAGVSRAKIEDAKSSTFAVQAIYALSKRTNLYGGVVSSKDKLPTTLGDVSAKRQVVAVGVRHTF
jgi:predicted porin